jgi:BirA family biotin operon repressor/biotin-[acetyl-CoA-carboxylase] ligase
MFEEGRLRECLPQFGMGTVLSFHPEVESTNDVAIDLAKNGAPHGALVIAEAQTEGRGRRGRAWVTFPGSSLALSIVLRPKALGANDWMRFHALGALAVVEALQQYPLTPEIKWPNDVLLLGNKVAGILVEVFWEGEECDFVVLGIGMNVYEDTKLKEFPSNRPTISVMEALGRKPDPYKLLLGILKGVSAWLPRIQHPALIEKWQEKLAYLGCDIVLVGSPKEFSGKLLGLNEDGKLKIVDKNNKIVEIGIGDYQLRLQKDWAGAD